MLSFEYKPPYGTTSITHLLLSDAPEKFVDELDQIGGEIEEKIGVQSRYHFLSIKFVTKLVTMAASTV